MAIVSSVQLIQNVIMLESPSYCNTAQRKKHQETVKHSVDTKQSKLFLPSTQSGPSTFAAKSLGLIKYGEASSEAVVYWLAKMACSNYSLRSVDHIRDLFITMFPDSKIALVEPVHHIWLGEVCHHILQAWWSKISRTPNLPFYVHFDETTTAQVKKHMDVTVRYWSPNTWWGLGHILHVLLLWPCWRWQGSHNNVQQNA